MNTLLALTMVTQGDFIKTKLKHLCVLDSSRTLCVATLTGCENEDLAGSTQNHCNATLPLHMHIRTDARTRTNIHTCVTTVVLVNMHNLTNHVHGVYNNIYINYTLQIPSC